MKFLVQRTASIKSDKHPDIHQKISIIEIDDPENWTDEMLIEKAYEESSLGEPKWHDGHEIGRIDKTVAVPAK